MNDYSVASLIARGRFACPGGKTHGAHLKEAVVKSGAIKELPRVLRGYGGEKAYVLCDRNTFAAAGNQTLAALEEAGIGYTVFQFPEDRTEPDEKAVG
ncbi:MAG: hypothetical protein IJK98_09710, partial [Clostridia bacterium]|nr:hypothetical protein [Clostridia bacterium]